MTGYQSKKAMAQDKLAQPEQELVATLLRQSKQNYERNFGPSAAADWIYSDLLELLNTTPPQRPLVLQREWVDLTDEEIDKWAHELHGVIYAVMAELKEKNNG